jgi:hypothetical protein
MGGGWIFVIVVVAITAAYLIGGVGFMYFRHGASKCPNEDFWKDLGSLIKDGYLYIKAMCLSCCGIVNGGGSTDYESM